jgi:hypothetical protein
MPRKSLILSLILLTFATLSTQAQWRTIAERRIHVRPDNVVATELDSRPRERPQVSGIDAPSPQGAWFVEVPASPGSDAFKAVQTFHSGGTMTETSDILATLAEGPGQGVWVKKDDGFGFTFELFAFDEQHRPAGRIRVYGTLRLQDDDHWTAFAHVTIITPDGEVLEDVGGSPIRATRIVLEK